jgi:hypothetical protein
VYWGQFEADVSLGLGMLASCQLVNSILTVINLALNARRSRARLNVQKLTNCVPFVALPSRYCPASFCSCACINSAQAEMAASTLGRCQMATTTANARAAFSGAQTFRNGS